MIRRSMARPRISAVSRRPPPLALSALLAAVVLACAAGGVPGAANAAEGGPAPVFRRPSLEGTELGPQDFAGDVVLLEFWATWCIPCHAQADVLKPLYGEFRDRGVQFLAVDLGEPEERVRKFVADNPFPYPVLIDPEDELSFELGIQALPTLMIVDRQGKVTYFRAGVLDEDELRELLARAGVEPIAPA